MKQIRNSTKEYLLYLIFGGLTTLVNYVIYFICQDGLHLHYTLSNVLAFVGAVLFAYVTNKRYVFETQRSFQLSQFFSFVSLRIVSMIIETGLLIVGVEWMNLDDGITKISVSILTVILNYVFGKYITFAKKED